MEESRRFIPLSPTRLPSSRACYHLGGGCVIHHIVPYGLLTNKSRLWKFGWCDKLLEDGDPTSPNIFPGESKLSSEYTALIQIHVGCGCSLPSSAQFVSLPAPRIIKSRGCSMDEDNFSGPARSHQFTAWRCYQFGTDPERASLAVAGANPVSVWVAKWCHLGTWTPQHGASSHVPFQVVARQLVFDDAAVSELTASTSTEATNSILAGPFCERVGENCKAEDTGMYFTKDQSVPSPDNSSSRPRTKIDLVLPPLIAFRVPGSGSFWI